MFWDLWDRCLSTGGRLCLGATRSSGIMYKLQRTTCVWSTIAAQSMNSYTLRNTTNTMRRRNTSAATHKQGTNLPGVESTRTLEKHWLGPATWGASYWMALTRGAGGTRPPPIALLRATAASAATVAADGRNRIDAGSKFLDSN